ncbi:MULTISPECIES: IPT/TIG domain-containing protein [unclassified Janthinobacterium]|uniref:IPT/TIG domain-containing protein n=1 Tax=unclassified Janthinobacterium TaxID=2610881 RepID=UPI000A324836|nr:MULTISPECIES: IPT/TIG domain-containing protein [unclassified Janthinobacterium]MCC7711400.1 IPT/TIG domain-containing protein [Janthinobacterium sp. GW460W]
MKNHLLVAMFLVLGLSACGGGGGGDAAVATTSGNPVVVPAVTAVSAANVAVGGRLVVTGTNLSRVTAFQVGGVNVAASASSDTSVTLAMPGAPVTGALSLVSASGTATTSYNVNVYLPLSVSSVAPVTGGVGSSVTIAGGGMGAVTAVQFGNGAAATPQSQTDGSVTVVVPAGAATGALTVRGPYNDVISSDTYTVLASVAVTSITSAVNGATLSVTLQGSNLDQVSSATVGNTPAVIVSASPSQLLLSAPASATGNVMLSAASRIAVNAGTVSAFTLGSIDFAQVLNLNSSDAALRLTRGKPAAVRVSVLATQTGQTSPAVILNATAANGGNLGSITMSGPSVLPTVKSDYSFVGNFSAVLPSNWILPGVRVRVTAVGNDGVQVSQEAAPVVASAAKIHLVLVPLSTDDGVAQLPDAELIRAALTRVYPYAAENISVTTRMALSMPGSSTADSWWSDALDKLENKRALEDSGAYYYGFVPRMSSTRTAGLAYINPPGSSNAFTAAIGLDARFNSIASVDPFGNNWPEWLTTLVHELGHNHSLQHIACGGPASAATDYPYPNGDLGPQPLYNSDYAGSIGQLSKAVYGSTPMKDVMSYCSGAWFSDYSYVRVQQFLERRSTQVTGSNVMAASMSVAENGYLTISGRITPAGVGLRPAIASSVRIGTAASGSGHAYILRVLTASGQTIDLPFDGVSVADHGGNAMSHFRVSFANPGDISDVQVLQNGKALAKLERSARRSRAAANDATFDATQSGGKLALVWNADAEPYAAVLHVAADGRKTVVASDLTGGKASVDVSGLPAGGRFEVSLSSSVGARLMRVQRR